MSATQTNVFRPQPADVINRDVVTKHHTAHGMTDHFEICLYFKERVSAPARVFSRVRAFLDYVNTMAQQAADVVDFLLELVVAGMRVGAQLEKQRVAASLTDILIVFRTLPTDDIVVPAEKAGKRMSKS